MTSSVLRTLTLLACLAAAPALAQTASPASPSTTPMKTAPATPPMKATPAPAPTPATTSPAPATGTQGAAKAPLLDINSASAEELSKLKGIGDVRSAAIIKGRPYKGKDELVQKKIVPEGVYAGIKDQIVAKQK